MNAYRLRTKITVREGSALDLFPGLRAWVEANRLEGKWLNLEITKWRPRRSLPANAFFHALCGEIARITGMDASLVKEGIKQVYGARERYKDKLIPKPSHLMDSEEMAQLTLVPR